MEVTRVIPKYHVKLLKIREYHQSPCKEKLSMVIIDLQKSIHLVTLSLLLKVEPVSSFLRGGFDWRLDFFWEWVTPADRAKRIRERAGKKTASSNNQIKL
jgi:hypothetical protein